MREVHNFFTKPIKYCMNPDVLTMDGEKTVYEVAIAMKERNQGCLAVLIDAGKFGIVTDKDNKPVGAIDKRMFF